MIREHGPNTSAGLCKNLTTAKDPADNSPVPDAESVSRLLRNAKVRAKLTMHLVRSEGKSQQIMIWEHGLKTSGGMCKNENAATASCESQKPPIRQTQEHNSQRAVAAQIALFRAPRDNKFHH